MVVDGFRSPAEAELFRKSFGKSFKLLYIMTGTEIRFARRKKDDPNANFEQFKERDRNDIEKKGLDSVLKGADFIIDNSDELEETKKQVSSILALF